MFRVEIETRNAAMQSAEEVGDALLRVAGKLHNGETEGAVLDANGNTVGHFKLEEGTE